MVAAVDRRSSCASPRGGSQWITVRQLVAVWSVLTLTRASVAVQGAAIYSNIDFIAEPNFEPICHTQPEHFIESNGKESSLILEFNGGVLADKQKSCTRILSAPADFGFIVRLILPKIRHGQQPTSYGTREAEKAKVVSSASALADMTSLIEKLNSTVLKTALGRTCPLSIFSSHDPHTPQWRIDPCQLEDTAPEMEDPTRLFHGRVRIVWEHNNSSLHSKLMVTVLGKGDECRGENKHPCLKIGEEPILCISKDLVCDGIRHCPTGNEYDSDEDYTMCWKRRRIGEPIPPAMESDIFEHFALEVFRNLFAFDAPTLPELETTSPASVDPFTKVAAKLPAAPMGPNDTSIRKNAASGNAKPSKAENTTESTGGHHRRNSTRLGLNSDLSKYGPWGYLMLGILLCGGALLICGLWASASQHAANNEREAALQNGLNGSGIDHPSSNAGPPNYEELDPPPAYSVLFPNQKAASSATLNSLGATTTSTTLTTAAPTPAPAPSASESPATTSSARAAS